MYRIDLDKISETRNQYSKTQKKESNTSTLKYFYIIL